jgi:hypothetical protein
MRWVLALWVVGATACSAPPPSPFRTARDALGRMHATHACSRGVQGEAKVDYFGPQGRVRASSLFVVARPERVRMDVFSPFGATLSTLTSDGKDFALLDLHGKRFFHGPARPCNVRRFLHVPIPPHALASLLTGEAPVLAHEAAAATIGWSGGRYVIDISSRHDASQRIALSPHPDDWNKPWSEQRVRVGRVTVEQRGVRLDDVDLEGHAATRRAAARVDPDGIDPDILPSGPACTAEVPRRLRFRSAVSDDDVIFAISEVVHNPPLAPGLFAQAAPRGARMSYSDCSE